MRRARQNRYMIAVLTAAVAMTMTAGCGSTPKTNLSPKNPVRISVWNYYAGAQLTEFNELVEEFNNGKGKELGIMVSSSSAGNIGDLTQNVFAAANKEVGAEELPNIFAAYADTVYTLNQMGVVEDIGEYLTDEEKASYIESYIKEGDLENKGELRIFPVAKATEILMLNETDWQPFAEATGTTHEDLATIEGVTEVAQKYYEWTDAQTEEPDDGKAFFGRDALANYMIIGTRELGEDVLSSDKDGNLELHFQEEIARKLWDNYYVPFVHGYFSAGGRFRSDDVKTGVTLSFVGSSSSASFFPKEVIINDDEKYPIDVTVLEAPRFADGEAYAVQQGAGMAVTKASEAEVEASVEFLKWFTNEDNNIRFSLASGYLPVKKDANDMKKIESVESSSENINDALKVSIDTVNNCTMYTILGKDGSIREILERSMGELASADREKVVNAIQSGTSAEEAIAQFDNDEHFEEWYQDITSEMESRLSVLNGENE